MPVTTADVIARVRTEIGDKAEGFLKSFSGGKDAYQIGVRNIVGSSVEVKTVVAGVATPIDPSLYLLELTTGQLSLVDIVPVDARLAVRGTAYPMFTDAELTRCVDSAVRQHFHGRTTVERYRETDTGFIRYRRDPVTLTNCADVEADAVAILATIEALWTIVTDASTDADITTAEGTHLERGQRFGQVMQLIDVLTARYRKLCDQFGIGLYRIEMSTMRRVSNLTGRYVPIFTPREYDEYGPPSREIPEIERRNLDTSGIPSPLYGGFSY